MLKYNYTEYTTTQLYTNFNENSTKFCNKSTINHTRYVYYYTKIYRGGNGKKRAGSGAVE